MKHCKHCKELKALTEFRKYEKKSTFYSGKCRKCLNEQKTAWVAENFEQDNKRNKAYNRRNARRIRGEKLRSNYWPRLTWEQALTQYTYLFNRQAGVCAICGKIESRNNPNGTPRDLAVDHCHKSGRVRGLLCNRCNRGIGLLKEDHALLLKAVTYLSEELLTKDLKAFNVKIEGTTNDT